MCGRGFSRGEGGRAAASGAQRYGRRQSDDEAASGASSAPRARQPHSSSSWSGWSSASWRAQGGARGSSSWSWRSKWNETKDVPLRESPSPDRTPRRWQQTGTPASSEKTLRSPRTLRLAAKREPPGQEASLGEFADDFVRADDGLVTRAERRVAASGATRETRARPVPSLPPPRGPPMCVKPGTPRAPSNAFLRGITPPSAQSEAASGAYKWKRQLTLIERGDGDCDVGLAEPVRNIPRDACGDYRAAQERPLRSQELYVDGGGGSTAEKLKGTMLRS